MRGGSIRYDDMNKANRLVASIAVILSFSAKTLPIVRRPFHAIGEMKTRLPPLVAAACLFAGSFFPALPAAEFWAAPTGGEKAAGTVEDPLSLIAAQRRARELRRLATVPLAEPVRIFLRGGNYALDAAWCVRPEDSGTVQSPTVFEAAPGETPVLDGGVALSGWSRLSSPAPGLPAAAAGQVWVAEAPLVGGRPREFRQLWIAGRKAGRARTPDPGDLDRLLTWDKAGEVATIPVRPGFAGDLNGLEMVIYQQWEIALLRVREFTRDGDAVRVRFHQPESRIQFEHPWPAPIMTEAYRAPFFLQNALCLLDAPGEWYHDIAARRVYYWPHPGEDLAAAQAIVPVQETLLDVSGSLDRPVRHVAFKGLHFAHTAWMRPALAGHVPHQAGLYMTEAYKMLPPGTPEKKGLENQAWVGRPPGAVRLQAAHDIRFERCRFEHFASAGLDAEHGLRDLSVEGCLFRDIAGNGLQLGKFQDGGLETHLPYNPADDREVCARLRIANNVVTDCANEDWGCLGIAAGYIRESVIEHNDLSELPYSGISLGWGWTYLTTAQRDNRVQANRITRFGRILYDFGGIYHLSASPGTWITENAIGEVVLNPHAEKPHWGHLYPDEGSSYMVVRDNWTATGQKLINSKAYGLTWERNGPDTPVAIRDSAGLQEPFRDLLELLPAESAR